MFGTASNDFFDAFKMCWELIPSRMPLASALLFAAWMAVWAVFLVYELSVARRMSQLRDDIERLKQQLREG